MQPKEAGVKEAYYLIEGDEQNITVVSPGKNGAEFNKTYGYFNSFPSVHMYHCLYGQGVLVMQRNDFEGEAKEFKVVTLNASRVVEVPAGWGVGLVNIGKSFLVVLDNTRDQAKFKNTEPIKVKKGFVYYVVEKKGEIGFDANINYPVRPQITTQ